MSTSNRTRTVAVIVVVAVAAVGGVIGWRAANRSDSATMDWSALPMLGEVERQSVEEIDSVVGALQAQIRESVATCAAAEEVEADTDPDPAIERVLTRSIQLRAPSEEAARERGLHLASALRESLELDAAMEPEESAPELSETELEAMHSVLDRCTTDALEPFTLDGSGVVATLAASYADEVLGDDAIAAAIESWRGCMSDAGHPIQGMVDATTELRSELEAANDAVATADGNAEAIAAAADELLAAERELALEQVRCDDSDFGPVLEDWAALEESWMSDHQADLDTLDPQLRLQWRFLVGL